MADRIQLRRDTAANWTAYNPILLEGEPGIEIDTDQWKLGDGVHTWSQLAYRGGECVQQRGQSTTVAMSQKAVTDELNLIGVFDISAHNLTDGQPTKYADLTAALGTNGANVPEQYRVPGMTIRYVQSSDNKYVQYRLITNDWSTNTYDWSFCVDDFLVESSEYLRALADGEQHLLFWIDTDGNVGWAKGVPEPIKEFLANCYIKKDSDKSLIDKEVASRITFVEGGRWLYALTDNEGKIAFGIKEDGVYVGITNINEFINNVNSIGKKENTLPDYYYQDNYISNRCLAIQESIMEMGRGDIFGFLTDTHPMNRANKQNGNIFRYIASQAPLQKVLFGGDIGPSDAEHSYGEGVKALEGLARSVMQQTERLYNPCREAGCEIYITRGNHDFACTDNVGATTVGSGYQATMKATRQMLFAYANMSKVVTNEDDDNSMYYYFDNKLQGIRYIVVDTSDSGDSYDPEAMISNVTMRISDSQIRWIVETAVLTTPANYKIVFMGHVMPSAVGYGAPESVQWSNRTIYNLNKIIEGIQINSVVTIKLLDNVTDYTCDFTSFTPKVLMYLGGHTHMDCQTFENGCVYYESGADWFTQESVNIARVETQLFGIALPARAYNTITENLVNVILIDITNEKIKLFRIGTGVDRIFNMHQIQISSGSSTTLTSSLTGTIRWKSYDAKIMGPSNNDMFSHTITSVGENSGVVTGLAAGESVVVAYSEEENRFEFFDINIV